jgi:hypothetical protein
VGSPMPLAVGQGPFLPRSGALHVVRLACERPDTLWHSLTQWDGQALARQLMAEGMARTSPPPPSVGFWRSINSSPCAITSGCIQKGRRAAAFYIIVTEVIDLYTRALRGDELVLSVEEKTSLHPRPRPSPTPPTSLKTRISRCPSQMWHASTCAC